jgi:thioredoxin-like negative regulator of GroEL
MSRMFGNIVALLIVVSIAGFAWPSPPDDIIEMLARAEALYYEADFAKSVELLLRADELLRQEPDHVKEKTDVKLQLALGFIGLNDADRAKAHLGELYVLDPDHRIDPQLFSPKVIRLAEEAKAEQQVLRCRPLLDEAESHLQTGNGEAVVKLIGANQAKCSSLATFFPKAADLVFKEGLQAYKKTQLSEALQKFRSALVLEPKHELAGQYVELTESKLQVTAERALLAWRKDFTAAEFTLAARGYHELASVSSFATIDEVRSEYRRALSGLVDAWNRACANNDPPAMQKLRAQIQELLPEPSFGEDILANMKTCSPTGCIQMDPQVALTRLRHRVDPYFPVDVKSQIKVSPLIIHVKVRINEKGEVSSSDQRGGHPLLYNGIRTAIDRWKFAPAMTDDGKARCVDTEIPLRINFGN